MVRSLVVVAMLGALARADAVDPAKLPALAIGQGKSDQKARVFATGIDAAVLYGEIYRDTFVARAGQKRLVGRFGDPGGEGQPLDAVVAALKDGVEIVHPTRTGKGVSVTLDFFAASAADLLRLCADVAKVDYVIAPGHELPQLVVRMQHVPVQSAAIAIAEAAGLQLVERGDVWVFVDVGAKLDAKLAAVTTPGAWIEVRDAHPGEIALLLDAKRGGACAEANVGAKLRHGQTGLLDAAARTVTTGAPCDGADDIDLDKAQLVGTLTSAKLHRALLRDKGRGFALATASDSTGHGTMTVLGGGEKSIDPPASTVPIPHPFDDAGPGAWRLVATFSTGTQWRAIFDNGERLELVLHGPPRDNPGITVDIDASHAWTNDRAFSLMKP